jgi:hypothetical protein
MDNWDGGQGVPRPILLAPLCADLLMKYRNNKSTKKRTSIGNGRVGERIGKRIFGTSDTSSSEGGLEKENEEEEGDLGEGRGLDTILLVVRTAWNLFRGLVVLNFFLAAITAMTSALAPKLMQMVVDLVVDNPANISSKFWVRYLI